VGPNRQAPSGLRATRRMVSVGELPHQRWDAVYAPGEAISDRRKPISQPKLHREIVCPRSCAAAVGSPVRREDAVTRGMFQALKHPMRDTNRGCEGQRQPEWCQMGRSCWPPGSICLHLAEGKVRADGAGDPAAQARHRYSAGRKNRRSPADSSG
jgi:hypothetical protein